MAALLLLALRVSTGTAGATITGGSGNDVIVLGGGNNNVDSGNGSDTITLSTGNDTVNTGSGSDTVTASSVLTILLPVQVTIRLRYLAA